MIKFRSICTAQYGHFAEVLSLGEELNQIGRARGWRTATYYVPMSGEANVLVAEYEYPDLATCDAEGNAAMSDPEWMKVFRAMAERIYPQSARTEILQEAPQLA